jgi:photosystem II stability/assembly factor-like uncharacterized protein
VVNPGNEDEWWVASVGGGVWHTEDAGETWESQTDDLPVLSATCIDICRNHPEILYFGTGEGFYNYDAIPGDGIFKSVNGGKSWTRLTSTAGNSSFRYVNRIIVDPLYPDTVVVATNSGIFRTENGGDSWTTALSGVGRVQQVIANPSNFNTQFAAVNGDGIYRSRDGGKNWTKVSTGISVPKRVEMAAAPTDTSVIYAAVTASNYGLGGLYVSTDGGDNWADIGNTPNWLGNQGWYDSAILVSPLDEFTVIVGGLDIYRLSVADDFSSFTGQEISHWYGGYGLPYVHADQHGFAAIADGSTFKLIAVNDGGVHYSPDGGTNWTPKNNGYNVTQFYDGDKNPIYDQYIAGAQDNGTNLSPETSQGAMTPWTEPIGGDGFDCAWDKFKPNILYGSYYSNSILKSVDFGVTFQSITNGIGPTDVFHTTIALNPFDSNHLVTATDKDSLYQTQDGGMKWKGRYLNFGRSGIVKIAFSGHNGNILWAGSGPNNLHVSIDKGTSFSAVDPPSGAASSRLTGINTSAENDSTAYLTMGVGGFPKIFRTRDLGQTWENITGNLPNTAVHTVIEMPYDSLELWAGTDIGLFRTFDGGQTWNYADGEGIPAVSIRRLKIVGKEIVAVTHGRGVFTVTNEKLPPFEMENMPPELVKIAFGEPETREVLVTFYTRSHHDSLHLMINNKVYKYYGETDGFSSFSESYIPETTENKVAAWIVGYTNGTSFTSNRDSIALLNSPLSSFTVDFTDPSTMNMDGLVFAQPSGFSRVGLHSSHPYAANHEYYAIINTPVLVKETSGIYFKDIAIVEPGETGSEYPEEEMWDYVTVEGSLDGNVWTPLIQPYDCRKYSDWNNAYSAGSNIDNSLLKQEKIDLSAQYNTGDVVIIRFHLFSDSYTTGWGWAVEDIVITDQYTDIREDEAGPETFSLYGNYPNPFNPSTTIRFSVEPGKAATLEVFNIKGQKVKTLFSNKRFVAGGEQKIVWNGNNDADARVASGVYFYRLSSGERMQTRRMILLK